MSISGSPSPIPELGIITKMESVKRRQSTSTPLVTIPVPQPASGLRLNPIQTTTNIYEPRISDFSMLSPPMTPVKRPAIDMPVPKVVFPPSPRSSLEERPAMSWATTVPKIFEGRYTLGKQIGAGAWSTVCVAEEVRDAPQVAPASMASMTPPPSPATPSSSRGALLAIKVPNQRSARPVIAREARVLTFLSASPEAREHIVGFHGQDAVSGSIVLDFVPTTLSRFVADRFRTLQLSTSTMYDPVIGETAWKDLAKRLIGAVAWLHGRGVAHGDIKADNILMRRRLAGAAGAMELDEPSAPSLEYEPVLCDFSSAHIVSDADAGADPSAEPDSSDAITTTYASPDLLASYSSSFRSSAASSSTSAAFRPGPNRTKADVWATAVCLVLAATGTEPYSEARLSIQKVAMARHGDVLGSVRGAGQATRIMKGGYVARTVALGLSVRAEGRVGADEWVGKAEEILRA